jgi:hypothetical protein
VKVEQDCRVVMHVSNEPGFNKETRTVYIDRQEYVGDVSGFIMFTQ